MSTGRTAGMNGKEAITANLEEKEVVVGEAVAHRPSKRTSRHELGLRFKALGNGV